MIRTSLKSTCSYQLVTIVTVLSAFFFFVFHHLEKLLKQAIPYSPLYASVSVLFHFVLASTAVDLPGIGSAHLQLESELSHLLEHGNICDGYRKLDRMDKLPFEVLSEIFFETLPNNSAITYESSLSTSISSPLYISHVCQRWREVARRSGRLWSYLSVNYNETHRSSGQGRFVEMFNTWLERSNGFPLNYCLSFDLSDSRLEKSSHDIMSVVQRLLLEQHRWKNIRFDWNYMRSSLEVPEISLTNMPMLNSLSFTMTVDSYREKNMKCAHIDLSRSTQIESLFLDGDYTLKVGEEPIVVTLMRKARLDRLWGSRKRSAIQVCLDLLRVSPNLRDFEVLHLICPDSTLQSTTKMEHILLAELEILQLRLSSGLSLIVDNICAPSLKCLRVDNGHLARGGEILFDFVQRSSPPLTHLHLGAYIRCTRELIDVLRLLPTLEELRLDGCYISSELFAHLTLSDRNAVPVSCRCDVFESVVLPRLRSFTFKYCNLFDAPAYPYAIRTMAMSRWENLGTFETIWIDKAFAYRYPFNLWEVYDPEFIDRVEVWFRDDGPEFGMHLSD